jgi:hypothetical protein
MITALSFSFGAGVLPPPDTASIPSAVLAVMSLSLSIARTDAI